MTLWDLGQRFVGEIREISGEHDHPFIQWGHMLCGFGPDEADETPWCSSWLNAIAWLGRRPRSKSARARSWLNVGVPVTLAEAVLGDVVILSRGTPPQPGPEVIAAPGHVGLYAGMERGMVLLLGGNQGNAVTIAPFSQARILGVRRLT